MKWTHNGILFALEGGKLHMVIDVSDKATAKAKLSKSGDNKIVATTGGWTAIVGTNGLRINLNVLADAERQTFEEDE